MKSYSSRYDDRFPGLERQCYLKAISPIFLIAGSNSNPRSQKIKPVYPSSSKKDFETLTSDMTFADFHLEPDDGMRSDSKLLEII
ncbi:hypothetical protein GWI33_010139 [Rhynchophorus ferrugineus]|uniref:Uncharacterized protein n=1 Tax=Rhynchophorus ferrugineus TaxID=354439 RepID=A0A834MJ30_RHYFE|nr:hypothetical protein GWI33_010139 [Rhynchophorus ferrugineus]